SDLIPGFAPGSYAAVPSIAGVVGDTEKLKPSGDDPAFPRWTCCGVSGPGKYSVPRRKPSLPVDLKLKPALLPRSASSIHTSATTSLSFGRPKATRPGGFLRA